MTDIFNTNEDNTATQTTNEQKQVEQQNQTKTIVDELVGEGRKFKSVEDLAKGKLEADTFISELQRENAEMREEIKRRLSAEEALKQIKEGNSSRENTTPVLDAATIDNLVLQSVKKVEVEKQQTANQRQVVDTLVEHYGDSTKAQEAVRLKAKELGLTPEHFRELAKTSPKAVLAYFNVQEKSDSTKDNNFTNQVNKSSVNTANADLAKYNGGVEFGTKAYFDNLRKTKPNEYYNEKTQLLILRAKKEGTYDKK